eukprot:GFUD01031415.1.p1 GENE.GFUD01031415.1~~GFUD01031415.1.p1  ORF type:complete len:633 (+),score=147.08 GFUD01031415.1:135-2033(+)
MNNFNQNPLMAGQGTGPSQGCFQPFRNNYNNNPIGALQERFHREGIVPTYQLMNTGGYDHARLFTMQVTLPNGLMAMGTGANKKTAKHNAARGMLDIVDGRANHVSNEVSQSITDGLKALRGNPSAPIPGSTGHKTFKPKLILNENQQMFIENQKKHQEELLRQQLQYGPLGVKLWFSAEDKSKDIGGSNVQEEPNRAPPEPSGPTDDEKLEKAHKSTFYIKEPLHEESMEEYLAKLLVNLVFTSISRRCANPPSDLDIDRFIKNTKSDPSSGAPADTICKMCNLVFKDTEHCDEHKTTTDHLHVVKGYFPGEGGYHCFLCWISFQQAEGLLNHISRANHQARCKKKGVLKIWMEPVANKSWDLINVHKHLSDLRTEGRSDLRIEGRSKEMGSRSRDGKGKSGDKVRNRRSREKDLRDDLGGSRHDQHDDRRLAHDRSSRPGRRRSPDRWSHDKYTGTSRKKSNSEHFEWKEVNEAGSSKHRVYERDRSSLTPHAEGDSRKIPDRDKSSSKINHIESSSSRHEKSITHHKERSSSVQYDVNLYGDHKRSRSRHSSASKQRLSESFSETLRSGKRSRRITGSDHEEVNEIQDDFEIDSIGKIENSEETLQKMKCAIIGILDEEISSLSKKIKK